MIVDLSHITYCEEWKKGVYAQDKLNVRANTASPLLPQSSAQKGGAYFQEHTVNAVVDDNYYVHACHCLCKLIDRSFLHYKIPSETCLAINSCISAIKYHQCLCKL